MEIWKDVRGYDGRYQVSSEGRLRTGNGKTMSLCNNGNGYLRVMLGASGRRKTKYIHRLVAEAFVDNPNNYPEVNHKDENKANNSVLNLEWVTGKYNCRYGTRIKRVSEKKKKSCLGISLTDGSAINLSGVADCSQYGFNKSGVSNCLQGLSKSSGGYQWSYI